MLENTQLFVQLRGLIVLRYFAFLEKIKEFIRKSSSSGPRGNCLKHREYCFTLLEDSRGEIFGEWIINLDGLCIWRWYKVCSKYLQNSFVYLSSRHVDGFWRLVLSSSWIASCFRNHCNHAQTVYRHLKLLEAFDCKVSVFLILEDFCDVPINYC